MDTQNPLIVSLAGYSGSGKTTFMVKLIAALVERGVKVATIKHDVHGFEMDKPGKDSWRHKKAGAVASIISSSTKVGLVMDADHDHTPDELARLFPKVDIVLAEGYKRGAYPKLEIFRPEATENKKPFCQDDPTLIGIISDQELSLAVPRFGLTDADGVAELLVERFDLV